MKEDDTQPLEAVTDEVSEARIVAWVLGEASAFEIAELERLCGEKPELEIFRRRMLALQGLLVEAVGEDKDGGEWKLSGGRRRGVEEVFGMAAPTGGAVVFPPKKRSWKWMRPLVGIAACLASAFAVWRFSQPERERGAFGALGSSVPSAEKIVGYAPSGGGGDALELAIRAQEDKVEESRKKLAGIVREKGIIYRGAESSFADTADEDGVLRKEKRDADTRNDAAVARLESTEAKGGGGALAGNTAGFGSGMGDGFAAAEPGQAKWSGRPRIVPPDLAANDIPAAPAAVAAPAPSALDVSSIMTGGLRSGDEAITRNNIDAILNNPARPGVPADGQAVNDKPLLPGLDSDLGGVIPKNEMGAAAPADPFIAPPADGFSLPSPSENPAAIEAFAKVDDGTKNEGTIPDLSKLQLPSAGLGGSMLDSLSSLAERETTVNAEDSINPFVADKGEKKPLIEEQNFDEIHTAEEAFSTFSLSVSDVSFQLAKAALERGEQPDPASIKIEQFYNAVDYGDPAPESNEPVAGVVEQSAHPVIPGRNLVRLGIRTATTGRGQTQPLRLTLLIDQSGSMVREDRKAAMTKAIDDLAKLMTAGDEVSVIGFSRAPKLLMESVPGNGMGGLRDLINPEASEGGTNLEESMKLARTIASRHKLAGAQNRIVLFTDGAANLGDADPLRLAALVTAMRQEGLAFDVAGIGADGLNDKLLANLARNGNGRYYVAAYNLAAQLAGAFRPAAEDVKVQVRFNPERVSRYKLIGFEESRLKKEDFRDDTVDAAELAAEEAAVAVYQVELIPEGKGGIGEMNVRFREAGSGEIVERGWTIAHEDATPAFDRASPSMQLAGLSMLAGQKLRGGPLADAIDFKDLSGPISKIRQYYSNSSKNGDMLRVVGLLSK